MMRAVQIRALGGAMARVPADATAFAHRNRRFMVYVAAMYQRPEESEVYHPLVAALAAEFQRGDPASYVGFLGDEGESRGSRGVSQGNMGSPCRGQAAIRRNESLPVELEHPVCRTRWIRTVDRVLPPHGPRSNGSG
jgi:hypothetical protein